jgi:HSP20 family protein
MAYIFALVFDLQYHIQTNKNYKLMYKRTFGIMPRTLGGFFEEVLQNGVNHLNEEVSAYSAPVNIQETDKSYELQLFAPGLKKEDFKLNIDKNILYVSYEQKEQKDENKEQQEGKWLRNEFRMKSFKRSFSLNEKVDAGKISARYSDGILYISLPKKEMAEPAMHEISVN